MKQELKQKEYVAEFDISDIMTIALTLIVAGIVIAYGLSIMSDVQSGFTVNSSEYNATSDAITGIGKLTSKFPLIVTIIVAAIVIGILLRYLAFGGSK